MGRLLDRVTRAGAAQDQPSGRALPALIAAGDRSKQEHMVRALCVNPSAMLLDAALPARVKLAAGRCACGPASVISRRNKAIGGIREISESLALLRARWVDSIPKGAPSRNLNLPIFHFATTTLGCEDKKLVNELTHGMPISGAIAKANVLTDRVRPAQSTAQEWLDSLPARNRVFFERTIRAQGSEMANECWRKTLAEVDARRRPCLCLASTLRRRL